MNNARKMFAALLSAVMLISANSQLLSVTADAATTERSMIQFDLAYIFPSDKQIKTKFDRNIVKRSLYPRVSI